MDKPLENLNFWHIRDHVFGCQHHETVLNCRRVCKFWNKSLERLMERMACVKLLQDFGDKDVENTNEKVSTYIPGWQEAVKEYEAQASIEDLREVTDSLIFGLETSDGKCCEYPVHEAACIGALKLIKFFLSTSYDMNTQDRIGFKPCNWADYCGKKEVADLIIESFPCSRYERDITLAYINPP